MTKKLNAIKSELEQMAKREALRVWRMARRAESHGCSKALVNEIRNEGSDLYNNYGTYPERLLEWTTKNKLKYAFCGERMKHRYLVINAETGELIRTEVR